MSCKNINFSNVNYYSCVNVYLTSVCDGFADSDLYVTFSEMSWNI